MYKLSMTKLARYFSSKLDRELRHRLVSSYKPLRWTPCFLHGWIDKWLKKSKSYSVIIEFDDCEKAFSTGIVEAHLLVHKQFRCHIKDEYSSISCCSAELTAEGIEKILLSCQHIKKIHFDYEVRALLDVASSAIRADILRQNGLTGRGVTIAVVDTGIHPHQDLTSPSNRIVSFRDFVNNRQDPYDDNGHGTHCAGDAVGNGVASNGQYQGPATEADVIGVKVLDRNGSGSLSTVMNGIEWCIQNKEYLGIDIISLSLGSRATQSASEDPMVRIVERAWDGGIVVCVAAGNEGSQQQTIASPGISPKVITVGAMDDRNTSDRNDDEVARFSSRGPTIDGIVKPDLLAPGVNIISLRSPNSLIDKTQKQSRVGEHYTSLSGTSMATPICAGVVAQLLQQSPHLTPDQVKSRILNATEDWNLPPNVQGRGYLDAERLT